MTAAPRHFLDLDQFTPAALRTLVDHARTLKAGRAGLPQGALDPRPLLPGRLLGMIFEKPSTRTRISFDVAIRQMGGQSLVLSGNEMQMRRGESLGDTARVLSRMVDGFMIRTWSHDSLTQLAAHSTVPVINGLTDATHPCQILADILTFEERLGAIRGRRIAWIGDGNNVCATYLQAASRFGFALSIACPAGFGPDTARLARARAEGAAVTLTEDPHQAVAGADAVVTDTWVSMNDTSSEGRVRALKPYQVNAGLMARAAPGALFLHCLPAHRGEEVTDEVIDGPQSAVFDEAENRVHAQKAVLAHCLAGGAPQ